MNKRILVALVVIALAIIPITLLLDNDSEASVSGSGTQNDPYTEVDIDATSVYQYFNGNNKYVRAGTVFNITEYDDGYIQTWVNSVTSGHGLYVDTSDWALKGTLTGSGTVTIEVMESDGSAEATTSYIFTIVTVPTYSVTFRSSDGGSVSPSYILGKPSGTAINVSGNTITIANETATATANAGYEFDHWELLDGNPVPSTLTQPLTIKAYFVQSVPTYTVTITAGTGGSVSSGSISNVPSGTAISVSNNTISINGTTVTATASSNYSFYNWTKSDGTSIPSTVTGDITIRANFQATYTITYNDNGGSGGPGTQSYGPTTDSSHSFQVPSLTPTRNGYRFWGWATTSSGYTSKYPGDTITLNSPYVTTTYYAIWIQYNFTLQYSANGGTGAPNSQNTGNIGSYYYDFSIPYDTPTRDGRTFLGWSTNSSSAVAEYQPGGTYRMEITIGGSSNARIYSSTETLYAVWQTSITYSYVLVYNPNGGSGGPPNDTQSNIVDSTYTFTTSTVQPTWAGHTFLGWAYDPTSTIPDYDAGTHNSIVVSGVPNDTVTTTLYAVWTSSYRYHLVTDFNGGEYSEQSSSDFYYPGQNTWTTDSSHTFSLSMIPTKEGYTFIGWADSSSATVSQYINSIELQGIPTQQLDKTIYAVWVTSFTYSITYDANGGVGAPATQGPYTSSEPFYTIVCPSTIPTYSGKVFLGWSRTTDVVDEHSGMEITLYLSEPNITLTAVWYTPEYEGSGTEYRPYTSIKIPVSQMDMLNGKYVSEGADIEIVGEDMGGSYSYVQSVSSGYGLTISNGTLTGEISSDSGTVNIKGYRYDGTNDLLWKDVTFTISAVFTLNFDVGDGIGGPGVQIGYSTGTYYDFTISGQVPVLADYDFVGWDSQYTAIHAEYQPGDTYRVTAMDDRVGTLYAVWMEHGYVTTYWSNGEQNGAVSVLYHMDSPARQVYHIIETMNLYKYNEGGTFTLTNNKIEIDAHNVISGGSYYVLISATYYNGDDVIASDTVNIGKWANFIVTVNPLENVITYTKVNNFASFQQYGTRETGKVIDLDTGMDSMTVYEIGFGYLNEAPRQQVVATKVFLNTYNVVMKDPTFDIDDYWPNQTNIRFALFSFALYGSTVTFNGYTFTVDKSKITFTYYVDNDKNYIYDPENPPDNIMPVTKSLTLTNLYVTWQDGHCYLTFNDANGWTIDMGTYTNREISMEGIWYFQSGMYESYTETETSIVKDWTSFNFDFRIFGLIALGLLVLAGVVMRMKTDAKLGDYLILFGAIGVVITMIGGLL